jgi:small subunit ribosomal protein S12
MVTFSQIALRHCRVKRYLKDRRRALQKCPQKKGVCIKVMVTTPKKPNSALRKITRVRLCTNVLVFAHIPGIGHNLQKYSTVLVRGGPVKDLPGMRYRVVRGKESLLPLYDRIRARSKYGVKRKKSDDKN